jgi:hypothetical protein
LDTLHHRPLLHSLGLLLLHAGLPLSTHRHSLTHAHLLGWLLLSDRMLLLHHSWVDRTLCRIWHTHPNLLLLLFSLFLNL